MAIITDSIEYKSTIRGCYEYPYANKLNNQQIQWKNTSTKLFQEEVENLNSSIPIKNWIHS